MDGGSASSARWSPHSRAPGWTSWTCAPRIPRWKRRSFPSPATSLGIEVVRGLGELTAMDLRLYLREPIAAFFTLAFPPLLLVLFGAIYGNEPATMFEGRGAMDVSLPAYTALILGTVAFLGIPINVSSNRETGVLRRYRAAGVPQHVYVLADVITNLVMTVVG